MEKLKEVSQIKMCWQAFYLLVDSTAEERVVGRLFGVAGGGYKEQWVFV